MKKERVDKLLTDKGLARSRTHAQALVMAGQVCVGDQLIKKSSEMFTPETVFRLKEGAAAKYVSRAGEKMEGALNYLGLDVSGYNVLDIGISTGGFSDCLLQRGAESIVGVDVGHNQLAWKLRNDSKVTLHEGVNARSLPNDLIKTPVDLCVIDVSFISLSLILPEAKKLLKAGGRLLALIKPQFEVEKGQVGKGGIVKDPLLHQAVQDKIKQICQALNFSDLKVFDSSIEGTDGNKEFFIFGINS